MIDLSKFSATELRALQADVSQQIRVREEQEKAAARDQILAIANRLGLPLEELLSDKPKTKGAPKGKQAPVKFRNPSNKDQEWSGRGRQPQWVRECLAAGQSLDELRAD
jgi:DNA-binding protein H-NS